MPFANSSDAKDALYKHFLDRWNDGRIAALFDYELQILWPNIEPDEKPDSSKTWLRVSTQTVLRQQTTLGPPGQRRFTVDGLIFVQFFFPKSKADSATLINNVADITVNIFDQPSECNLIQFYRARSRELPEERDTYRLNVVAEYEYDELG